MFDFTKIKKKNICIIGLMGSGKSIIGRDLSKQLNVEFYDTDKEIELKTNKSINLIFKEEGESYFREIEERICLELLNFDRCIISLGGGSIINKKIRRIIKLNSYSVYLKVNLNNLLKRTKLSKKRPLLNFTNDKRKTLENILNDRKVFYEKADFIVNNDNDKLDVIEKIKSEIKFYEK